MRKKQLRLIAALATLAMGISLFAGCTDNGEQNTEVEDDEPITVYMWSTVLYDSYAPYIQSQLPDVNIQFVAGNNDLDYYKFMNENGTLPDIITCRRFSLHDAAGLKDSLMDLSTTDAAGTVYNSYLTNFTNTDGTVNWLPLCAEVDGLVANKALFEKHNIPLPTDYESFVSACQAFEKLGIRGFIADFSYDYTCLEILQGLSIPELTSIEGRQWRIRYENPADTEVTGLDNTVWPEAFERMEQFINDVDIHKGDVEFSYTPVLDMFRNGEAAMMRAGGSNVVLLNNEGVDAIFLPYFGQNGEQWLLTYPQFQVALNRELVNDKDRMEKALKVLNVMISEEAQNVLAKGEDVVTYNKNVDLKISPYLDNLKPLIDQNRLYIRIASNDFFSVSNDVVSKMIERKYDAKSAYEDFDSQLRSPKNTDGETLLTIERGYSNRFEKDGGNEAFSVMANTLRGYYGSDVLIAPALSFTGTVFKADYTEKMVGNMIMPNTLVAYYREMNGAELKETVKAYVEGIEGGFNPFNSGSLPTVSGIFIEVKESDGKYTLTKVLKDGQEITDDEIFRVTCLNTSTYMKPLLDNTERVFEREKLRVKIGWVEYIKNGGTLAEPENYIVLN